MRASTFKAVQLTDYVPGVERRGDALGQRTITEEASILKLRALNIRDAMNARGHGGRCGHDDGLDWATRGAGPRGPGRVNAGGARALRVVQDYERHLTCPKKVVRIS